MTKYNIGDRLVNNNKHSDFYDEVGYVTKVSMKTIHVVYKHGFQVMHINSNPNLFIKIEKNADEKYPTQSHKISFYKTTGGFWFRIFGYGFAFKNKTKEGLLFSETNGYSGKIIGNYHFKFLKPVKSK